MLTAKSVVAERIFNCGKDLGSRVADHDNTDGNRSYDWNAELAEDRA